MFKQVLHKKDPAEPKTLYREINIRYKEDVVNSFDYFLHTIFMGSINKAEIITINEASKYHEILENNPKIIEDFKNNFWNGDLSVSFDIKW